MALFIATCPYCESERMTFNSLAHTGRGKDLFVLSAICPECHKPIGAWVSRTLAKHDLTKLHELNLNLESFGLELVEIWPKPQLSDAPKHLPATIERIFLQAEDNMRRRAREAAGMAYRRSLDIALKDKGPEIKGTLEKRIDEFAAKGGLTPTVAQWAHSIRSLGNEAAHDEGEPTENEISDLAAFTRVVLEYLYTLPEMVRKRFTPP